MSIRVRAVTSLRSLSAPGSTAVREDRARAARDAVAYLYRIAPVVLCWHAAAATGEVARMLAACCWRSPQPASESRAGALQQVRWHGRQRMYRLLALYADPPVAAPAHARAVAFETRAAAHNPWQRQRHSGSDVARASVLSNFAWQPGCAVRQAGYQ